MNWRLLFWLGLFFFGCAPHKPRATAGLSGPDRAEFSLYNNPISGDKIFVEARLGPKRRGLFLVDTGSAISVISQDLAEDLGVAVEAQPGSLVGVAGRTAWSAAVLPELRLGPYTIRNHPVAVDVAGVPSHVGLVPLAGIIGNDILDRFRVTIDFPANRMTLEREPQTKMPATSTVLFYNGQQPKIKTTLTARNLAGVTVEQPVLLQIDTATRGLVLQGGSHAGLETVASTQDQVIQGVGSRRPQRRTTKRVPVVRLTAGGAIIDDPIEATWLDYDVFGRRHAPEMYGLLGYSGLRRFKATIDFKTKQFALTASEESNPKVDVHQWFLQRGDPTPIDRVKAMVVVGKSAEAERMLSRMARQPSKHPEATILFARMQRSAGDIDAALGTLNGVPMHDLAKSGEIVSLVNTLWLQGFSKRAKDTAYLATVLEPKESASWIATADLKLSEGDPRAAREAVAEAIAVSANPNTLGVRRAVIAWMDNDIDGALTYLRRLVRSDPGQGYPQWLYARIADTEDRVDLVVGDLVTAEKLVGPDRMPYDFAAGAWAHLGDTDRAQALWASGMARDCERARTEASQANCSAWYQGLIGRDLPAAEALVRSALEEDPNKSEYLDTLAMILEAQGRIAEARRMSLKAALQQPDDPYLVTQAIRLRLSSEAAP